MGQTVNFSPSSISCGVTAPSTTTTGVSQCAPLTAPANVTAHLTNDTSGGALTLLSVASYLPQLAPPEPPEPPVGPAGGGGSYFETKLQSPAAPPEVLPRPIPIPGRQGPPRLMGQSNGVTPLPVAAGEFVQVTVQFAPTAATPDVCTATLQINADTWNPVSLPVSASVGELKLEVSSITINVQAGEQASVTFQVISVAGPDTTADLYLTSELSPDAPNVTASVTPAALSIGKGQRQFASISVSAASDLPDGYYFWSLGVWAFGNAYSFSVPVTIIVGDLYYSIKSKLSGNVIDVVGASTAAGAGLDAWPQKSSGTDNQLWAFVADPAGSGYFFIKSKLNGNVIDIVGASTKAGALLDAWPQKSGGTDNQLWEFVADPGGSGYFFIKSKLNDNVIDIQGASTQAGALLNAYPWKLTGYDNQLWTVVGGQFPSVVETVPQKPLGGTSGTYNYILANGTTCATLTGVKATIYFTEDLVWESSSQPNHPGFSIQLNAETNATQPLDWLQFVVHMGNDQNLFPWIYIWKPASSGQPGNPQSLWDQSVPNPVVKLPQAARIPAGYSIIIALQNDSDGKVAGASFTVLDASGTSVGSVTYPLSTSAGGGVPQNDLSPVASFQVTFGGALDGAAATFSSGAGVIIYEADQEMNVLNAWPACIGYQGGTAEGSNIGYSALEATPSTKFSQAFGVV